MRFYGFFWSLIPRYPSPTPNKSKRKRQGRQLRWPAETDSLQNLSIFSHFHASLAIQPRANKRWIIFKGLCQKSFQSLGFNVLKSRREFSNSLRNRRRQRIWAKTVDHNADIKFELIKTNGQITQASDKINPCHIPQRTARPFNNNSSCILLN